MDLAREQRLDQCDEVGARLLAAQPLLTSELVPHPHVEGGRQEPHETVAVATTALADLRGEDASYERLVAGPAALHHGCQLGGAGRRGEGPDGGVAGLLVVLDHDVHDGAHVTGSSAP